MRADPKASSVAAWASNQRDLLAGRDELEQRFAAVEARYEGTPIPRPDWWGAYRIDPLEVELWQGQPETRRHDRFRYRRVPRAAEPQWRRYGIWDEPRRAAA